MTSPDPRGARSFDMMICPQCHYRQMPAVRPNRCPAHGVALQRITVTEVQSSAATSRSEVWVDQLRMTLEDIAGYLESDDALGNVSRYVSKRLATLASQQDGREPCRYGCIDGVIRGKGDRGEDLPCPMHSALSEPPKERE